MSEPTRTRPGVMYAAVNWPVDDGPSKRDIANDLEILALTLCEEHGWTYDDVESAFYAAVDAAERWDQP